MLRVLVALLLLANLLFFAWTQGWLGALAPAPQAGQREPARIGAQVRPELIVVLPLQEGTAAVSAARAAAVACMEAGPFSEGEIGEVEAALKAAGLREGSWGREQTPGGAAWVVFAGRYPDAAARRAREAELRRLGLAFEVVEAPAELAPGFVLSRHASRDAAELALAAVADKPIAGVRVAAVPPSPLQHWLRAPAADADLQARLVELDRGFKPCAPRP
jgi:hypothetical protein